jgi:hypothetical protein
MTISRNPDANVTLGGELPDFEGEPRTLLRDFDCLVIPAMTLSPAGVAGFERLIGVYRNEVARYRLRTLDFAAIDIDLDECREDLAFLGFDPGVQLVDWVEIGERFARMDGIGGYDELRKLHALLTADEVPVCTCVISGGPVLPACCTLHGIPCEVCEGVESCADDCGEVAR